MFVRCLSILAIVFAGLFAAPEAANANVHHYLFGDFEDGIYPPKKVVHVKKHKKIVSMKHRSIKKFAKLERIPIILDCNQR